MATTVETLKLKERFTKSQPHRKKFNFIVERFTKCQLSCRNIIEVIV